jgi:hypothetical protein
MGSLFIWEDSQVPVTAPTSDQMHDVLWKEMSVWLNRMPEDVKNIYDWSTSYIRMVDSPETWFARAKTARKENPEALAGIHADHVLMVADEASGVPEEIYNTAEGALTNANILVLLISNPTRLIGYFYNTHNRDSANWQTLSFGSLNSPIVDYEYVERIKELHGEDSDEYSIRVLGEFPRADSIDDKGYVPLFAEGDVTYIPDEYEFRSHNAPGTRLGIDCAGEGKDKTVWTIRDRAAGKKLAEENLSTPIGIAQKTLTLCTHYGLKEVYFDGMGVGAKAAQEFQRMCLDQNEPIGVNVVLTQEKAQDADKYMNIRAETAFRMKDWIRAGGQLVQDKCWEELSMIKYRRTLRGKIQVMPKLDMRKILGKSPDYFDSLALTFVKPDGVSRRKTPYRPKWDGTRRV